MAETKKSKFVVVLILYLAGLFMGALDTGIVTPARTVIQSALGVDANTGIWMITIYTLFYAASIPIMGKLADVFGRKWVYMISIFLFGTGSLFCGLSSYFGGFGMLVISRAVQAIGGGGIMPIATAEFGTSFPPEKRGMALGLVGGVYGIANVFGASVGSAIMDLFGTDHWAYIFFINVPITVIIVVLGLFTLENHKTENTSKLDFLGIATMTVMIFSLLYGLKSLDFFDFANSVKQPAVYLCLLIFALLLPVFILIERKAQDPVMNLNYFSDRNIALALVISMMSGFVMMGMIFVPQFSENVLHMETGSGGYLVIILGLFAGASAPVSGKMTDKFGAKAVLMAGFIISAMGSLFLIFITTKYSNFISVLIGLMLIGLGMGFTMGTPLNYIMLANTDDRESNSALAAMSLVRSIGTAVAPAIMVGFISHAGMAVSDNIMEVLPQEISIPKLPYYEELMKTLEEMKNDPDMADQMEGLDEMPDLSGMTTMKMDMGNSDYEMPDDLLDLMQNSDVTNIVANIKILVNRMFEEMVPDILAEIDGGINKGITGMDEGRNKLLNGVSEMQEGVDGISRGIDGMKSGIDGMTTAISQMNSAVDMLEQFGGDETSKFPNGMTLADFIPEEVKSRMGSMVDMLKGVTSRADLKEMINNISMNPMMPDTVKEPILAQLNQSKSMLDSLAAGKIPDGMTMLSFVPKKVQSKMPADTLKKLKKIKSVSQLKSMIKDMKKSKSDLVKSRNNAIASRASMQSAMAQMNEAAAEIKDTQDKMQAMRDALPGAFDEAKDQYLVSVEKEAPMIEKVFQDTLNEGFKNVYWTSFIAAVIAILLLIFYSSKKEKERMAAK
ncbi:MAG: DHA2 family efflux MFS transporter permease subunit [Clostridiales bacterium]|nr:DHA2 family efflux MFS transporter permease subunit [Candidatus Crickella caballi]